MAQVEPPTGSTRPIASRLLIATMCLSVTWAMTLGTASAITSPGTRLWLSKHDGWGAGVAANPTSGLVYALARSSGAESGADFVVVAYRARNGNVVWTARYDGPAHKDESRGAITVSPDGSKVVLTGSSVGANTGIDFVTVAYDASTGTRLWAKRYDGPANGKDYAVEVNIAPDGSAVYTTGSSQGIGTGYDTVAIAYDAASGARLWISRYEPGDGGAAKSAVRPDGAAVLVTSYGLTRALDPSDGSELWSAPFYPTGPGASLSEMTVSPDGGTVFATGRYGYYLITQAYDASTGAVDWTASLLGTGNHYPSSIVVSPDGSTVTVAGSAAEQGGYWMDWRTVSFDASDGTKLWESSVGRDGIDDEAVAMTFSADGSSLVVTGVLDKGPSSLLVTIGYGPGGEYLWYRSVGSASTYAVGAAIAVRPAGAKVFVVGGLGCSDCRGEAVTIAYAT